MTKRKRRALEQAQQQEEQRRQAARPRVMYGPVNADGDVALPIIDSSMKAVQLPPIIQPISLLPYLSELNLNFSGQDDFVDDFDDDFDDMF